MAALPGPPHVHLAQTAVAAKVTQEFHRGLVEYGVPVAAVQDFDAGQANAASIALSTEVRKSNRGP